MSELILDLHGGVTNKRRFAEQLSTSLSRAASVPQSDYGRLQGDLVTHRAMLSGHSERLHVVRDPWGISLYDLQSRVLGIAEDAALSHRLPKETAARLSLDDLGTVSDLVGEWIELGGPHLPSEHPEWNSAAIATSQDAQKVFEAVCHLAVDIEPAATAKFRKAVDSVGLAIPGSVTSWRATINLLTHLETFAQSFDLGLLDLPLDETLNALEQGSRGPAARFWALLASAEYREAKRVVREASLEPGRISGLRALAVVGKAVAITRAWQEMARPGVKPSIPVGLAEAAGSVGQLVSELAALGLYMTTARWLDEEASVVRERLRRLSSERDIVARIPRIRDIESLLADRGMREILESVWDGTMRPELAAKVHEHAWLQTIVDEVSFTDPDFASFAGSRHDSSVSAFRSHDRGHVQSAGQRIRRAVAENLYATMNEYPQEAALVRKEAGKKKGHLAVRRLFASAPNVMLALRPCWTMSPLLVSELVPAGERLFDVVIFDEASQVSPAEAIASLARAPQAVVAGDSKQLPPTTFFHKTIEVDEEEADDSLALTSTYYESILDVLSSGPLRETMLLWHYRSRDERLINFSNAHLYFGALTTFPGAIGADCLRGELVPFNPHPGRTTSSSPDEVERVVELVMSHARSRPEMSLGVIAMGQAHASNIEEFLRQRMASIDDPDLEEFFSEEAEERFFVKNIERVQGDERDAIILSVGYHKDVNGNLPYHFGPLNQEGGERRLNVAITRSRSLMTVVSSFDARDMQPGRSKAQGVELLRQYFEYLRSGGADVSAEPTNVLLNPFELHVERLLTAKGIPLTPQYGVSGYRIDFAAAHPDRPGEMVLAIEADGASYHSSESARERDRLRQEVLENLGWHVHRIWSTEWFKNPEQEAARTLGAWRQAVTAADGVEIPAVPSQDLVSAQEVPARRGPRPRIRRGEPITVYSSRELLEIVKWISSDTLLRTDDQLFAETQRLLGYKRRGSRINIAIQGAIDASKR